jgi:nicotinate-nucleotide adenylyltransferase
MTPFETPQGAPGDSRGARRLGVLGGTFDPVHFGHLDAADAARAALSLHGVLFVPSYDPPHRANDPRVTAYHRFALVALAIQGRAGYRVSDLELTRGGSSYTADTLRMLHAQGWPPAHIFFILGADAFADIATWREFPAVLDAANFIVIARPGTTLESALMPTPSLRQRVRDATIDVDEGRTCIFLVEARTRDVSSSLIRQRLAAQQPIDDLVPSAVARHLEAHRLYTEDNLHDHQNT